MRDRSILSRFLIGASLHAAAGLALFAWQVKGVEQAGSLFVFWMWFVAILFSLNFFGSNKPPEKRARKSRALLCLNLPVWLFFTAALVWAGYAFLPSVMVFGLIATHALQSKYDDQGNLKKSEGAHA